MVSTDQRARNFFVPVYISSTVYTKANCPFPAALAARPWRAGSVPIVFGNLDHGPKVLFSSRVSWALYLGTFAPPPPHVALGLGCLVTFLLIFFGGCFASGFKWANKPEGNHHADLFLHNLFNSLHELWQWGWSGDLPAKLREVCSRAPDPLCFILRITLVDEMCCLVCVTYQGFAACCRLLSPGLCWPYECMLDLEVPVEFEGM